jgi:MerR family mercuric resistance operon transcriptional regulator
MCAAVFAHVELSMDATFSIGTLARAAGVPVSTVRFYERRGLLTPDSRTRTRYRVYEQSSLDRLKFIKSAHASGFTLGDIAALLDAMHDNSAPCGEVRSLVHGRLGRVAEQIDHLTRVRDTLRQWLAEREKTPEMAPCRVVNRLSRAG